MGSQGNLPTPDPSGGASPPSDPTVCRSTSAVPDADTAATEIPPSVLGSLQPEAAQAVARELLSDSTALPPPPEPGRELGRHRLLEELGRGGMGVVYRAHDTRLGRDVALKVLKISGSADGELVERFKREARAAAALDHPRIIRVHDVDTLPDGSPYYTMELLSGQDLARAIADGRLSTRDAVEAIRQVADGLQYAHEHGVLHRDIKPQNIFLRRDPATAVKVDSPTLLSGTPVPSGRVDALLLDFGLAKLAERDLASHAEGSHAQRSVQSLTRSGEIFGTPAYMSPEQTRGAKDVDARADIYSLGASLYHALVGEPPFKAPTLAELLEAVHGRDPSPPSESNAEVDADLDTVCVKCLQKDPNDRYRSAGELAQDLGRWLAGEAVSASPIGLLGRVWRKSKRNRAVAVPVALLSSLLLVGLLTWGGVTIQNHLRYRGSVLETRDLLARGKLEDALKRVGEAQVLAPDDPGVKQLVASIHVARGRRALDDYARARALVENLEEEEDASSELPAEATEEQADALRSARWKQERDLKTARRERGRTWSEALRPFLEALTQVSEDEDARRALAELYWDEYARAETLRDRAEEARYMDLVVQFGGSEYEARVRGTKEVRVRLRLPTGLQPHDLVGHLYQYASMDDPPVLVPVPFDPLRGAACDAPRLGAWKPLPLSESADGTPSTRLTESRWGSAFDLRSMDRNRVQIPVDPGVRASVLFRSNLPRGSYLLHVGRGQGVYETRYPFEVMRGRDWDETCDLVSEEAPPLPSGMESVAGATPSAYWVYIPAGPYQSSGDREAQKAPPRRAAWIHVPETAAPDSAAGTLRIPGPGAFFARFEVTSGMYRVYLNDATWHGPHGAFKRSPRQSMNATEETNFWENDAKTGWRPKREATWWTDEVSFGSISWDDLKDYCDWLTKRLGGGAWTFELPTEDEWERAARGPDGRYMPWGDSFDFMFCHVRDSRAHEMKGQHPEPVGMFPVDESPFGLRDMGGGMREWTATRFGSENQWIITKGGAWSGSSVPCRSAGRSSGGPGIVPSHVGFRLVARRIR